ncbi:MAG: hypothetical protein AAB922_04600 [Patescibacteria group bacterium]
MADFYKEPTETVDETAAPEKIKLGEKEYSQEELQKLVGLGEIGASLEAQWNTKIDKLMPEFVKKTQKLAEIEPEWEQFKKAKAEAENKPQPGAPTPEEKEQARKALVEILGGEVVRKDEFDQIYAQRRATEKLLDDVDVVIEGAKELGKPETTKEALLTHMRETGIRNPEKAYKDLFEDQLEKWKADQLTKAKPSGLFTQAASSAGSKQPEPVKITKDNLASMLSEVVSRE